MKSIGTKIPIAALFGAFALLMAACGDSGSADVASLNGTDTTAAARAAAVNTGSVSDDEAAVLAFTECMRELGIEYKDPEVDADGNVLPPEPVKGAVIKREDVAANYEECGDLLEGVTFEKERKEVDIDQWVEIASCLGDEGYDFGEPTADTIDVWFGDFRSTFPWDDSDAQDAYETCTGEDISGKSDDGGTKSGGTNGSEGGDK